MGTAGPQPRAPDLSGHQDLELAVEVRQCPLRPGAGKGKGRGGGRGEGGRRKEQVTLDLKRPSPGRWGKTALK